MLRANPPVDPFPPIVEPADPGVLSGLSRHLSGGDKPPAGADLDVVRQAMPDVADADQPVQAGMGDEHHVRGRTGGDRGERPAHARRQDIGHRTGPFGQLMEATAAQPGRGAPPALRRPVATLGEDNEGALGVQAGGQAVDLAGVEARSGLRG